MRKPTIKRKKKNIKETMNYETTREDKKRRKEVPTMDLGQAGQVIVGDTHHRRYLSIPVHTLRYGHKVYRLVIQKVIERAVMLGILIVIVGTWTSGFMAAKGMAFWSLLTFVLAFIIGAVVGSRT